MHFPQHVGSNNLGNILMPLIKSASREAIGENIEEMSKNHPHDQAVAAALETARRAKRAKGGKVHVGPIIGTTGGRADERPMEVPNGAYVFTADHVSGLGEGNTHAGMEKLNRLFPKSAKSHAEPKEHKRASGGKVPIYAADGEYVVHPEDIKDRYGDLDYGHKVLDAWQEHERKHLIHTLSNLDGPEKD